MIQYSKDDLSYIHSIEEQYNLQLSDLQARDSSQGLFNSSRENRQALEKERVHLYLNMLSKIDSFKKDTMFSAFRRFGTDYEKIYSDAVERAHFLIEKERSGRVIESIDSNFTNELILNLKKEFSYYYEFLKDVPGSSERLDSIILDSISEFAQSLDTGMEELGNTLVKDLLTARTQTTNVLVSPLDKVSDHTFLGKSDSMYPVQIPIRTSDPAKPIYTSVTIEPADLDGVSIRGKNKLTEYDRAVLDAILSLHVRGNNQLITINMIFQAMTGKSDIHCSPNQRANISESITKLMFSHVTIDASQELSANSQLQQATFDSNLLNAKRIKATINGVVTEAIQILSTPILFDYARQKKQVAYFPQELLNTPQVKSKDNIILEGYLRRAVMKYKQIAKKGVPSTSPVIKYEDIYDLLDLQGNTGTVRNKKKKVRDSVKIVLSDWIDKKFIKGYNEIIDQGRNIYIGLTIDFDKN